MLKRFTAHLFYKLAMLIVLFFVLLTSIIFYTVDYYYTDQDTILDAQELFFYSDLVSRWDFPEDTTRIKADVDNLGLLITVFDSTKNRVWFYPQSQYKAVVQDNGDTVLVIIPMEPIDPVGYTTFADTDDFLELHNIKAPLFGSQGVGDEDDYLTKIEKNSLYFFLTIDQETVSEYVNYIPPLVVSVLFMLIFNLFVRKLLRPIRLMERRIKKLKGGDMKSKIKVIGNDELAGLSESVNKMVEDIRVLLSQKQQLLLDVSHELRSPLTRMRLLVEMLPDHKNQAGLVEEIVFLEGMISNLLLSDKLSLPYSNLEYAHVKTSHLISKVLDLVNVDPSKILINNDLVDDMLWIDETKIIIALRNLFDNALKYGVSGSPIELHIKKRNGSCVIDVKNKGNKIDANELNDIFLPFFRSNKNKAHVSGFGLGLTICKKIVESHGGLLLLQSDEMQTIFSIEIPYKKQ